MDARTLDGLAGRPGTAAGRATESNAVLPHALCPVAVVRVRAQA
ncbi:hypothetical protein ABZY57_01210 [Streptomyces sp. NPDC006450]